MRCSSQHPLVCCTNPLYFLPVTPARANRSRRGWEDGWVGQAATTPQPLDGRAKPQSPIAVESCLQGKTNGSPLPQRRVMMFAQERFGATLSGKASREFIYDLVKGADIRFGFEGSPQGSSCCIPRNEYVRMDLIQPIVPWTIHISVHDSLRRGRVGIHSKPTPT